MTWAMDYAFVAVILCFVAIQLGRFNRVAVPLLIGMAVAWGAAGIAAVVMTHWNSAISYLCFGFASAALARYRRRDATTMPPT